MAVGGENINSIMTTAAQKLSKSNIFDATISHEALAVLSQKFALDVCFGHPDAVSYIDKGVASHLRICYSTIEDRTWSFTGYPSEPLLSCAAADLLHQDAYNLVRALEVLKNKVDGGMFEIGQSGELTSTFASIMISSTIHTPGSVVQTTTIPGRWSLLTAIKSPSSISWNTCLATRCGRRLGILPKNGLNMPTLIFHIGCLWMD
jgi:hypothetical protein